MIITGRESGNLLSVSDFKEINKGGFELKGNCGKIFLL
jgi:hypothetical protein